MISRRRVVVAFASGALTTAISGLAQNSTRVFRIGWLALSDPKAPSPPLESLRAGLEKLGYVEGRNIVIDARASRGSRERADQMVIELVKSKVDVIVTQGGAAWSAYRYAGAIPVVMGFSGDPVEAKFVDSFARPGGSRTGMSFLALELVGKRLELLAEIAPSAKRMAVVANPAHPGEQGELRASQVAAQNLGISLGYFPVHSGEDVDSVLAAIASQTLQGLVIFPDAITLDHREKIAAFGVKHRMPTVSGWSAYADSGVLLTYGPNLGDCYAHLATYVDKILKGAKPADLPMELPTSVELAVNMKSAKAIGTRIPQSILVRADRVIE
ncbi:MAG TPA: ABC transporter substrate-binding protein [Casimicrobiaceae bacterium]|nr:ABC transporter substrate-binding protein [Casimicrobiaceae bacterium]